MSTRSLIGQKNADGSVDLIYCHFDGYPENNGAILFENYQDPAKVSTLISLGDISHLGEEIGVKHPFDRDWSSKEPYPFEGMTLAYGRDRGEMGTEARHYASVEALEQAAATPEWFFEEFLYLFDVAEKRWY